MLLGSHVPETSECGSGIITLPKGILFLSTDIVSMILLHDFFKFVGPVEPKQ